MCTTVLGFDPGSPAPVLLIGVRDEILDRPWVGPGRHWPQWPGLIGGRDLLAGGTWLAVDPAGRRVACVLNGRGRQADPQSRLSRGELPLRLAGGEDGLSALDPARYDPFHLLCATPGAARLWSWDGGQLTEQNLAPGLHIIVNSGLEGGAVGDDGPGAEQMRARVAHFRPLLVSASRPTPQPEPAAQPASTAAAWGDWLALADGGGLDSADPRALLVRGSHLGQAWGSSSVSLVALTRAGARYDFRATRGESAWTTVLPAPPPAASADR
jgi:Transport and Golgi organisation 2